MYVNWQNELRITQRELKDLSNEKERLIGNIQSFGKNLVKELQKIQNWECLIYCCRSHYEKYPSEFFDWCSYEFDKYDNKRILYVKKYYQNANPDGYVVLKIDLDIPLEKQVANKLVKDKAFENEMLKKKQSEEFAKYERLKKKFEK